MSDRMFSYDASAEFAFESVTGISTDDDGDVHVDWDTVESVTVTDAPFVEAFDTDEFYKIAGTITRPVEQTYRQRDGSVETYTKPADELRKAAWSADNAPFALGHPDTGVVKDTGVIHGFWKSPEFDDEGHNLDATLYLPTDDEEAKGFVEDNGDLSIGFYHGLQRSYDGEVGDVDESSLDGYQTDLLIDHVASVDTGRCPGEEGCGLATDSMPRTLSWDEQTAYEVDGPRSTEDSTDAEDADDDGDTYYAVKESEGGPSYPIEDCNDVKDAYNLRNNGDYSISTDTLVERIKSRASDLDCGDEYRPWQSSDDQDADEEDADADGTDADDTNDKDDTTTTMTDDNTNDGTDSTFNIDVSDLALDTIADRNDEVAALRQEASRVEALDALKEAFDEIDEDVEDEEVADRVEDALTELSEARSELEERREEDREAVIDDIEAVTDRYEDQYDEMDLDELEAKRDELEELSQDLGVSATGVGTDEDGGEEDIGKDGGLDRTKLWQTEEGESRAVL